jgi:hypothetical protein
MFRQLLSEHPYEFKDDKTTFDLLVRMQHYGLPTRLLDVSHNPLVGLYFACCSNPKKRGQVVVVHPQLDRMKYFDGDVVSMMSNLVRLKQSEKKAIVAHAKTIELETTESRRSGFNVGNDEVNRLLQHIRQERPNFLAEIDFFDLFRVISVVPRKIHPRIRAQNGAFLLYGLEGASDDFTKRDIRTEVIDIHEESKKKILSDLSLIGISTQTLFPEIDKTADQIKKRYG